MARQILLRQANSNKTGLQQIPSSISDTPDDLLSMFPQSKRAKIKKMLDYLHNDTAFRIHPHSLEITPNSDSAAPFFYKIDMIDLLNWFFFSRSERPALKQPPGIEHVITAMSGRAKKLISKDKRQNNSNSREVRSSKQKTGDIKRDNNNDNKQWLI